MSRTFNDGSLGNDTKRCKRLRRRILLNTDNIKEKSGLMERSRCENIQLQMESAQESDLQIRMRHMGLRDARKEMVSIPSACKQMLGQIEYLFET